MKDIRVSLEGLRILEIERDCFLKLKIQFSEGKLVLSSVDRVTRVGFYSSIGQLKKRRGVASLRHFRSWSWQPFQAGLG